MSTREREDKTTKEEMISNSLQWKQEDLSSLLLVGFDHRWRKRSRMKGLVLVGFSLLLLLALNLPYGAFSSLPHWPFRLFACQKIEVVQQQNKRAKERSREMKGDEER